MKISISVSGPSGTSDQNVRCGTEFEVATIDQTALQQITHAARQCAATIASISANSPGQTETDSTRPRPQPQSGRRLATEKQVKAIQAMARRQGVDLPPILRDRFGASSPTALAISEASTLIDELKNNLLPA